MLKVLISYHSLIRYVFSLLISNFRLANYENSLLDYYTKFLRLLEKNANCEFDWLKTVFNQNITHFSQRFYQNIPKTKNALMRSLFPPNSASFAFVAYVDWPRNSRILTIRKTFFLVLCGSHWVHGERWVSFNSKWYKYIQFWIVKNITNMYVWTKFRYWTKFARQSHECFRQILSWNYHCMVWRRLLWMLAKSRPMCLRNSFRLFWRWTFLFVVLMINPPPHNFNGFWGNCPKGWKSIGERAKAKTLKQGKFETEKKGIL